MFSPVATVLIYNSIPVIIHLLENAASFLYRTVAKKPGFCSPYDDKIKMK